MLPFSMAQSQYKYCLYSNSLLDSFYFKYALNMPVVFKDVAMVLVPVSFVIIDTQFS